MKFSLQRLGKLKKKSKLEEKKFWKKSKKAHWNSTENRKPLGYQTFSQTNTSIRNLLTQYGISEKVFLTSELNIASKILKN